LNGDRPNAMSNLENGLCDEERRTAPEHPVLFRINMNCLHEPNSRNRGKCEPREGRNPPPGDLCRYNGWLS
jgi:hypothetical protein